MIISGPQFAILLAMIVVAPRVVHWPFYKALWLVFAALVIWGAMEMLSRWVNGSGVQS